MKENKAGKRCARMISILFVIAAVTMIAAPVWAADRNITASGSPFAYEPGSETKLQAEKSYPSSFDLRNMDGKSYVTPVRVQNPFGTCWGFAATAAAESSILANDDLNKDLDPETFDLSEKHLAWFAAGYIDDPSNPQNGEGTHFFKDGDKADVHYNTGGYNSYATLSYAAGIGPQLESDQPYCGAEQKVASWNVATHYDEKGNPQDYKYMPVWYSLDDDWTIPESERFGNCYRLKDSYILPMPADITYDKDGNRQYSFSQAGVDAIKDQLSNYHRAVAVSFTAESYLPGQDTSGKEFMSSNWAHYTWKPEWSNHVVTVVGWDDNYPKENFLEGHQPEGNGAFLIKNSWGSELNEFPNNAYRHWGLLEGMDGIPYDPEAEPVSDRATGYFWISYYDQSLISAEAFLFDKANTENGYYVEQHDYMLMGDIYYVQGEGLRTANVFTTEATSELSGISVMTTTPGTEVSYEIYLLRGGYTGPEDGVKLTEGKAVFEYGGYHKIELEPAQRAVLSKDQDYSVIVSEKTPSGNDYFPISMGTGKNSRYAERDGFYMESVINEGESYVFDEGKWQDLSDKNLQYAIIGDDSGQRVIDNLLIKSYLEPVEIDGKVFEGYLSARNWALGTPGTFSFKLEDDPITLTAEFKGTKVDDPEIKAAVTWTSSDQSIFTIEPNKTNASQAVLTPQGKEGIAYLTVDAGEYGGRVVGVSVGEPKPEPEPEPTPDAVVKKLTVLKGRKLKVTVKDQSDLFITGYEINYRIKGTKKWKKAKLTVTKTSKTLTKLKKGKRYQVRVRWYLDFNGTIVTGNWSKTKLSKKIK